MLFGAPAAIVAYVPLVIGVVIWTVLLQRRNVPGNARNERQGP